MAHRFQLPFKALAALAALALSLPALALAAAPQPPVMQLGDDVKPLAYALDVTVVPDKPGITGRVDIDVDLAKPLSFFWINGSDLEIRQATLTSGRAKFVAKAIRGGKDFIGLQFGKTIPAGPARLSIAYAARFSLNETRGAFKQKERGEWYAYTQFEAVDARRAFPSFDEPRWKTPWTLTMNVRREHVAVTNNPVESEKDIEGGMKQVRFKTTPPLPTYLVAFAAGPFDVVDGGTAGINKTPLRYIVPKGRASQTRYAKETTPKLVELLEEYFGRPYPYAKFDSVAIPITIAFGAMENPGMITYQSGLLTATPERENDRFKQYYTSIGAHEIAHQWFGDLVTMKWWDDVWLNESFATWMARKVVGQYRPEWDVVSFRQRERNEAMGTDRLSSTRQIRQPVRTRDDLGNAFDRITYDKGGAILTMFEQHVGQEKFRDGVRAYLNKHAWGNASAEDFFAAIGQSDPVVAQGFASFVLQPGLPVIDFMIDCSRQAAAVVLRQSRFEPLAPAGKAAQRWTLPVCMRVEGDAGGKPVCTMMREQQERIELAAGASCPAWVLPNPGGVGYYLSRLEPRAAAALPASQFNEQEATTFINDQALLAGSGALPWQQLLASIKPFTADARPAVVGAAAHVVGELNPALFDTGRDQALGGWVREHFGARAAQLGWLAQPGDSDAVKRLRGVVVPLVAEIASDAQLRSQARSLALAWLGGDRGALGAMTRYVLQTAAYDGDAALFDAMSAALAKSDEITVRSEIFEALGHLRDPVQRQRAFELALSPQLDARESSRIFEGASEEAQNAVALLGFMQQHFDALQRRMPEESVARVPRWHTKLCSAQDRKSLLALYGNRRPAPPGFERNLAQTAETVDICLLARAASARH
ncbi:M1 family metallopeptidase [Caenimonas koreensis]|nr:M1 family metallopeptidase [Caenimonas koreensis]